MAGLFCKQIMSVLFGLALNYVVANAVLTFSASDFEIRKASIGSDMEFSRCIMDNTTLLTTLRYSPEYGVRKMRRICLFNQGRFTVNIQSYEDRILTRNSSGIVLKNVGVKDSGFYRCRVELRNDSGNEIESRIQLKVGVAPTIKPLLNLEILEELSLKVVCNARGLPAPEVTWFHTSSGRARVMGTSHTLALRNIEVSQSGMYHCRGMNYMGVAEESMEVKVYRKPGVREFFNVGSLDGVVWQCQDVRLQCEVFASRDLPIQTYRLYQRDKLLQKSDSGMFLISYVGLQHSGAYSCVPQTRMGLGRNKTLKLHVKAAPRLCKENPTSTSNRSREASSTVEHPRSTLAAKKSARNRSMDEKRLNLYFVLIVSLFLEFLAACIE